MYFTLLMLRRGRGLQRRCRGGGRTWAAPAITPRRLKVCALSAVVVVGGVCRAVSCEATAGCMRTAAVCEKWSIKRCWKARSCKHRRVCRDVFTMGLLLLNLCSQRLLIGAVRSQFTQDYKLSSVVCEAWAVFVFNIVHGGAADIMWIRISIIGLPGVESLDKCTVFRREYRLPRVWRLYWARKK